MCLEIVNQLFKCMGNYFLLGLLITHLLTSITSNSYINILMNCYTYGYIMVKEFQHGVQSIELYKFYPLSSPWNVFHLCYDLTK